MYPSNYFVLFPPFPLDRRVFVAMSFAPQFDSRWANIIKPAIENIRLNNEPLIPFRVDQRTINDSILTEILDGIGHCRLFFADISTIGFIDGRPIRNANVMYEIGIAHAVRMPPEVVLFRSDNDQLLFDVSNIRVNHYAPDSSRESAFQSVQQAILNGIREIELFKQLSVKRAAARIDVNGWSMLGEAEKGAISPPDNLALYLTINRLLEEGVLETFFEEFSADKLRQLPDLRWNSLCRYRMTPFGSAVVNYLRASTNIHKVVSEASAQGLTLEQYHAALRTQSSTSPPAT